LEIVITLEASCDSKKIAKSSSHTKAYICDVVGTADGITWQRFSL
jgi:hypothetical protein